MHLDRSVAPPSQPIRHIELVQAVTHHLPNEVPVHIIRAGQQPVVSIELIFRQGGIKHETRNAACFFALKMLSEGTQSRTAYQVSNSVDSLGAYLQITPGLDYSSVQIYCLSKHADQLLQLLQEILTQSAFVEAELTKLKDRQKQQIRLSNEKISTLASKEMKKMLFGQDHPYGKSLTEASIDRVVREDVVAFYENCLRSSWEVVLSGDVNSEVIASVERYLGKLSHPKNASSVSASAPNFQPVAQRLVERKDSLQSSLRVGLPLFKKDHPDYHVMRVVNTILGGYFGSRLMRNIREEKGLTYGISSGIAALQDTGYLVVGTEVKKQFTQLALDEIYKEAELLCQKKVSPTELETVKSYLAGRFLKSANTPFALVEKFKNIYLYSLTYDFYQNYLKTLESITPQQVLTVANRYLIADQWREVVVGEYA